MKKEQFNVRISEPLHRQVSVVGAALNWKKQDVAELALAILLGKSDATLCAKRRLFVQKAKELGQSFEMPVRQQDGLAIAI